MRKTRATPAGVEVKDLRVKNTPPANNSIRGRAVMCSHFLSVRLCVGMHIHLFLTRLGFCHTITSLLKTEARLGGSFTIHGFVDFTKNLQKKFAFPSLSSILYYKGLETLARSGCNADIVGVTPVQLFYKSILGLSSGIYASTTSSVFPARQALFVCAWKHRQEENKNCQTRRRTEQCKANSLQRNSGRTLSVPSEQLNTLTPKTPSCPPAKQTHLSLKSLNFGSMTALKKSSVLAWIIGQKPFELLQSKRYLIVRRELKSYSHNRQRTLTELPPRRMFFSKIGVS